MLATATATKFCPACQQEKPVSDFDNDASKADGKRYRCKQCDLDKRPSQTNTKFVRKNGNGKLRAFQSKPICSVRLEYRRAEGIYPPMWWKVIDNGGGVPATSTDVWFWRKVQALEVRVKQLEAQA